MELGSHPDLESIPDDLASISDLMGSALKGLSAPLPSPSEGPPFTESHKALRRLLLKQMPAEGVSTQTPVTVVHYIHTMVPLRRGSFFVILHKALRRMLSAQRVSYTPIRAHKQYLYAYSVGWYAFLDAKLSRPLACVV